MPCLSLYSLPYAGKRLGAEVTDVHPIPGDPVVRYRRDQPEPPMRRLYRVGQSALHIHVAWVLPRDHYSCRQQRPYQHRQEQPAINQQRMLFSSTDREYIYWSSLWDLCRTRGPPSRKRRPDPHVLQCGRWELHYLISRSAVLSIQWYHECASDSVCRRRSRYQMG